MTKAQETYISFPFRQQIKRWEKLRTLPIARQNNPTHPCGYAHRIGSVGDLALYRLKIHDQSDERGTYTLPGMFLLQESTFQLFLENRENKEEA